MKDYEIKPMSAAEAMEKHLETKRNIDLTPSWSSLLPALIELIAGSYTSDETKKYVATEFKKMAQAADAHIASKKKTEIIKNKISKLLDEHNVSSGLGNELTHVINMISDI